MQSYRISLESIDDVVTHSVPLLDQDFDPFESELGAIDEFYLCLDYSEDELQ